MKKKLFITTIFAIIISATSLIGQERSDYSIEFLTGMFDAESNPSSVYYFGNTWSFCIGDETLWMGFYHLHDGHVKGEYTYVENFHLQAPFQVSSCVFNKDLYLFYSGYSSSGTELKYRVNSESYYFSEPKTLSIPQSIKNQISTLEMNDTLYMFFVDDADEYVKYHRIALNNNSELELVSTDPVIINQDYKAKYNVVAITYADDELHEKIMVAYAGAENARWNNKINVYTGTPDEGFELYQRHDCYEGYHAKNIAMIQGSAKGGNTEAYCVQLGYTFADSDAGMTRCELNMKTHEFTPWGLLDHSGIFLIGGYAWFLEFFTKGSQDRQKYVGQGYACGDGSRCAMWKSDKLEYADETEEVAPISHGHDFFDLVLVAEGAPPYALNGYQLDDGEFDGNPPSEFQYVKSSENSVSTSTTYSLGVEANMGAGPVTAGFKASFQESHGTSVTISNAITRCIIPPKINSDSAGEMFYYYIAPTVVRERWVMKDYAGNEIVPNRNLFFFKLNSPQMQELNYTLDHYGDNSPRAYNLETYKGREPQNISGVEDVIHEQVTVDFAGSQPALDIDFSESHTESNTQSYEVSVGVDAEYGIFSASASVTAGLEYERERTTTYENGFHLEWLLFSPKNPDDESNIRMFRPTSWIMKTTNSNAYFLNPESIGADSVLFEEFKKFKPWFITYSIDSISYGNFTDSPYYIGENSEIVKKYNFHNYPNPFSHQSKFDYTLSHKSNILLCIYNTYGQLVSAPINETQSTGNHQFEFNSTALPAGIYYYRMLIDEDLIMGKIIKN